MGLIARFRRQGFRRNECTLFDLGKGMMRVVTGQWAEGQMAVRTSNTGSPFTACARMAVSLPGSPSAVPMRAISILNGIDEDARRKSKTETL